MGPTIHQQRFLPAMLLIYSMPLAIFPIQEKRTLQSLDQRARF